MAVDNGMRSRGESSISSSLRHLNWRFYAVMPLNSLCTVLVTHPFHVMHARTLASWVPLSSHVAGNKTGPPLSLVSVVRQMRAESKLPGSFVLQPFYRGLGATPFVIFVTPTYWTVLEGTRVFTGSSTLGALTAQAACLLLTVPRDNVVQSMAVRAPGLSHLDIMGSKTTALSTSRYILRNQGLRGFLRGYTTQLLISAPAGMAFWALYNSVSCHGPSHPALIPLKSFAIGAFVSAVTTPLEIVRIYLQVFRPKPQSSASTVSSLWSIVRRLRCSQLLHTVPITAVRGGIMYTTVVSTFEFAKWIATVA